MDERVKRKATKRLNVIMAYQKMFDTKEGEMVLGDLMLAHGMLTPHSSDPQMMAIKEGERAVVLRILTYLKTNPKDLLERINNATLDE